MNQKAVNSLGQQSVILPKPVYIRNSASVVGKKEGEGPLSLLFDLIGEDDMFGANSWEEAESSLQQKRINKAKSCCVLKRQLIL